MLRTIALSLLATCGPMYGKPQPAQQTSAPEHQISGPPGGGSDPWSPPATNASPDDPYASAPPAAPARKPAPPPKPVKPSGGGKLPADSQALLDAHNRVRAKHCAGPLAWSPKLEQVAQQWASTLVKKGCVFGHSGGQYGENLAAGTIGALDGESTVQMWYDEGKSYNFKRGGFSMNTGHFTQVVWRATTQVGCAKAQCKGNDIYVCEYDPPGNVDSEYQRNVLAPGCK
jgi:uncharacterized protein YkwD